MGVPAHAGRVLLIHPAKRVWKTKGTDSDQPSDEGEEEEGKADGVMRQASSSAGAAASAEEGKGSGSQSGGADEPAFVDVTEPYCEVIGVELGDRRYKYGGAVVDETGEGGHRRGGGVIATVPCTHADATQPSLHNCTMLEHATLDFANRHYLVSS